MTCIAEMVTTDIQTLSIDRLHTKQKKNIYLRNLAVQSYHKNKKTFKPVIISLKGLLQKQQYMHGLKKKMLLQHCVPSSQSSYMSFIIRKGIKEQIIHLSQYRDSTHGLNYAKILLNI